MGFHKFSSNAQDSKLTNDMRSNSWLGTHFMPVTVGTSAVQALACTEDEAYKVKTSQQSPMDRLGRQMEAKAKTWIRSLGNSGLGLKVCRGAQGVVGLRKLLLPPADLPLQDLHWSWHTGSQMKSFWPTLLTQSWLLIVTVRSVWTFSSLLHQGQSVVKALIHPWTWKVLLSVQVDPGMIHRTSTC